jgi:hypothetical protein
MRAVFSRAATVPSTSAAPEGGMDRVVMYRRVVATTMRFAQSRTGK